MVPDIKTRARIRNYVIGAFLRMDRVLGTRLQSVCLLDRKAKPALGTYI